eukprot:c18447_g1_i1 orf=307-2004(-)
MEENNASFNVADAKLANGSPCNCRIDGVHPVNVNSRILELSHLTSGKEDIATGSACLDGSVSIGDGAEQYKFVHSYDMRGKSGGLTGIEESESQRKTKELNGTTCSCPDVVAADVESVDWRALERCITSSIKGFAVGAGLRGGLTLFSLLMRLKQKRSNGAKSLQRPVRELANFGLSETLRYGLFLGSFAGTFSTLDELIAALWGFRRTAKWRSLIAGAVAGPSLLLTGKNAQHTSMAIYILVRASVLAARCGIKSGHIGWLCSPFAWKHGDMFMMCLSSSQILSSWIMKPESLSPSYVSFLNKHGGKDRSILQGIKDLAFGKPITGLEAIFEHYKTFGVNVQLDPKMKIPCMMVHGDRHCISHFFWFLCHACFRSLPVYIPVYLVPAVIVHRQGLLKKPLSILLKTAVGAVRSSLFLSTYCASAWLWTCCLFRATGRCNPAVIAMGTFPTGLALMIEKKSRRMEIALYCFSRALESFGICIADLGLLPWKINIIKRIDVILFSFATSIIMHCYAEEREVFLSKYLNVLDWVFGIPHDGPPIIKPLVKVSSVPYLLGYKQGRYSM